MFIIQTRIGPSTIHGTGVFADEDVAQGQPIWQFAPGLDLVVPFETIAAAPKAFRDYMDMYAYISPLVAGGMILSCDHAKFLNHSDDPQHRDSRAYLRGEQIGIGQEALIRRGQA